MRLFVSAAEASGDRYAAAVLHELAARHGAALSPSGIGGEALAAAGLSVWPGIDSLAVAGISEALSALPTAARSIARFGAMLLREPPDLALLVDSPGLNLRLAWLCKRAGVPVVHYVAPQRWAWLPGRVRKLPKLVDRLAVTLSFEEAFFRARGVDATFVGHPLVELFAPSSEGAGGWSDGRPALGLFPGSRRQEIARHLPLCAEVARRHPELQSVVAVAGSAQAAQCRGLAPELLQAPAAEVFAVAQAALCAAGSVTLEAALAGVPQVVFYRLSKSSYWLAKRLLRVSHVALPNLLLGERLVPELLQDRATPDDLSLAASSLFRSEEQRRQLDGYGRLRALLGPANTASRVADICDELRRAANR